MNNTALPLEKCPALVLNADYRPLSYFPLSLWSWQDALRAVFRDSVVVISQYDRDVHSPSISVRLPSVLALKDFVPNMRPVAFTRFNVYLRDEWHCQYCGMPRHTQELTFDHVIPRSRGGRTIWSNIVAACHSCNVRKGDKTPEASGMYPLTAPREPTIFELQKQGRKFPPNFLHESWRDFLYWDTELVDQ